MDKAATGHRKRMRERYAKVDLRTLHDYEILEMLLYSVIQRGDTRPIAKELQ